jgi:hypothetical protein
VFRQFSKFINRRVVKIRGILRLKILHSSCLTINVTINQIVQGCKQSSLCSEKTLLNDVVKRLDPLTQQFERHRNSENLDKHGSDNPEKYFTERREQACKTDLAGL